MTPIGHGATGYLLYRLLKLKWPRVMMGPVILGSLLPDIDFLLVLLFGSLQIHRTFTHSISFVFLAALITLFVFRKSAHRWVAAMSLFAGGLLHLLIDASMDTYPANGLGVPLLYPFSEKYFLLFNLLSWAPELSGKNLFSFLLDQVISFSLDAPFLFLALFLFFRERRARIYSAPQRGARV